MAIYKSIRLAGQPYFVSVEAASLAITDRSKLTYHCEIFWPRAYRSAEYVSVVKLQGKEAPSYDLGGVPIWPGWKVRIDGYLAGKLNWRMPPLLDTKKVHIQALGISGYKVKTWIENDGMVLANSERWEQGVVMTGGLRTGEGMAWKDTVNADFLKGRFLTWQPNDACVGVDCPVWLSWLVALEPLPAQISVRVRVELVDGFTEEFTAYTVSSVLQYSILNFQVGYVALNLGQVGDVAAYSVWLVDANGEVLSETRRYVVNWDYRAEEHYLAFQNSLGGIDVLPCYGTRMDKLSLSRSLAERALTAGLMPQEIAEQEVFAVTGERIVEISTGHFEDGAWIGYLEEVFWSKHLFFAKAGQGFEQMTLLNDSFDYTKTEDVIEGRVLKLRSMVQDSFASFLPEKVVNISRPTRWVAVYPYYVQNESGFRVAIGSRLLELRYADGEMEPVAGVERVVNLPGVDGYTEPVPLGTPMAPFTNVAISRQGTYEKKDCAVGVGTAAVVAIAAGQFGGETQADADRLAEATWAAKNTQAYANEFGSCSTTPETYVVAVPAGYTWWRISEVRTHYADNACVVNGASGDMYGNAWWLSMNGVNEAEHIYASGKWNIGLPNPTAGQEYVLGVYGANLKIEVYVNGFLTFTKYNNATTDTDDDGFVRHQLDKLFIPNQARVYVKLIRL